MALTENIREVDFEKYCETCKHKDLDEKFDPCNECLDIPYNDGTSKPVKWSKKE